MSKARKLVIDSFAGGGGASLGIAWALGRAPDIAINHDPLALAMHEANHPSTRHIAEDVCTADLRKLVGKRAVGLLWASPDCKDFSRAKGDKPVSKAIRSLAWVVVKWADQIGPDCIILENVREFAEWGPVLPAWQCQACDWRGTEGQAKRAAARRRCPRCNSLRLRVTEKYMRDPTRKGITFKRWCGRLRSLGYDVQHRVLNAADFGAPTHRRRLFLVARRDGKPIVWPEPTHGDPKKLDAMPLFNILKPWRTAAECIDWSLPCPSIFERKKDLRPATLRRIAMGIKRYVLENPQPFIVGVGGRMGQSPEASVRAPMNTITAKNDRGIVVPYLTPMTHSGERRPLSIEEPVPTITTAKRGEVAVTSPILVRYNGAKSDGDVRAQSPDEPISTIDTQNRFAVVSPTLIQTGYGEREGQEPRVPGIEKPLGSVVAGGAKHALVSAFLAKHFGGVVGHGVDQPASTITSIDHHGLVAANLVHMNHGEKQWSRPDEPLRTVPAGGNHAALVYSFLIRYFGTAIGQHVTDPLFTITGKDRFGLVLVTVAGEPYYIADIGMRMLVPRELARAQGFPDTYSLAKPCGAPMTKTKATALIGNSVSPYAAEAMVRANLCLATART